MKRTQSYTSFFKLFLVFLFGVGELSTALYPQAAGGPMPFGNFADEEFSFDSTQPEYADYGNETPDDQDAWEQDTGTSDSRSTDSAETADSNSAVSTGSAGTAPEKAPPPDAHSYFFRYTHTLRQGARFAAGTANRSYIGYLQLESPLPMPYFEVSVKNFGIGLYPLAALQTARPEKNIPSLFIGAGCLTFGSFLKTASRLQFSGLKPGYTGIRFPGEAVIGMGSAQKEVQYGIELYGAGWNGAFFAAPEKKKGRMRYGLMGGWQMNRKKTDNKLSIRSLAAFLPEVASPPLSSIAKSARSGKTAVSKQPYHSLFGLDFVFMHPIVSFTAAGLCSSAADKTISGGIRAETALFYRYFGLNGGGSYTAPQYIGWDVRRQKEQISAFVQPYLKVNIVSLHALYAFSKEDTIGMHSGGFRVQVKHKNVRWQTGWEYGKELHTVKTGLTLISSPAWFRRTRWFETASASAAAIMEDMKKNPLIVKKYTLSAAGTFRIVEGVFCGINGTLSQSAATHDSFIYMQQPLCKGGAVLGFKRTAWRNVHSGKLEIAVKNEKPYFDLKIGYQIRR